MRHDFPRKSGKRAALIDADELESLLETAHLLSSPANAERLLAALQRSLANENRRALHCSTMAG